MKEKYCLISACGKTTFVKNLLQNHKIQIQPNIDRVVWLYKRWQPLYSVIKRLVLPEVEFVRGIPSDLDDDDYFDPSINNLLILDDLFSEAGKDKRITDLFTEGSHHRSLSVISINQNLFGNKDISQRRNSHFIILFKNPVDKLSVMTLARQMYPGHSEKFMTAFEKATKQPYGHLIVDLKPFTPEGQRLKYVTPTSSSTNQNTEWQNSTHREPIKEEVVPPAIHSSVSVQTVDTEETMDKGQACDDCGQLFDTVHDVQRHIKNGRCPENGKPTKRMREDSEDEEPAPKWRKLAEDENGSDGYEMLWKRAKVRGEGKYNKLYDKYVSDGETPKDAKQLAEERMESHDRRNFEELYSDLLESYLFPLRTNTLHQKIVAEIDTLRMKGISLLTAIRRVLRKYRPKFNDVFDEFSGDESNSDDEDSETEDSDSDDGE